MIKPALIGLVLLVALGLTRLPVLDYLPLLVLLACRLMMIYVSLPFDRRMISAARCLNPSN